jgi:hypothetical protein
MLCLMSLLMSPVWRTCPAVRLESLTKSGCDASYLRCPCSQEAGIRSLRQPIRLFSLSGGNPLNLVIHRALIYPEPDGLYITC